MRAKRLEIWNFERDYCFPVLSGKRNKWGLGSRRRVSFLFSCSLLFHANYALFFGLVVILRRGVGSVLLRPGILTTYLRVIKKRGTPR